MLHSVASLLPCAIVLNITFIGNWQCSKHHTVFFVNRRAKCSAELSTFLHFFHCVLYSLHFFLIFSFFFNSIFVYPFARRCLIGRTSALQLEAEIEASGCEALNAEEGCSAELAAKLTASSQSTKGIDARKGRSTTSSSSARECRLHCRYWCH